MGKVKRTLSRLKVRFPRAAYAVRSILPSQQRRRKRFKDVTPQEVFSQIYEGNDWGDGESRSGGGSTMKATDSLRSELPGALAELGIQSMLDAPCGDFHWMRQVDLGVRHYIGADIVPTLIEELNAEFENDTRRSFRVIDLTTDPLPDVDLLFCRDCLQHLTLDLAQRVLDNFRSSSCKYLITTTFPDVKFNSRGFTGGTNALNMLIAPFNLPSPLRVIEDHGSNDAIYRRCMGVWSKDQLL